MTFSAFGIDLGFSLKAFWNNLNSDNAFF